jgi:glycosyltransferase involved in cell wall biosynthesis
MTLDLSIVVPAYNEAHRLEAGFRRFDEAVAAGAVDLDRTEVLVVDDGSTDDTAAVADKLLAALPHHRVLRLPVNGGKGAAVRTGVAASRARATAYMDADMAIDPMAVPLLLRGLESDDVAIGCRALRDSMVETTYVVRTLISRLFNELVTAGTGLGLKDTQCGFKAFRTPAARLLFHLVRIDRFAFDVEVLARAKRLGLGITEVPVHWRHVDGSTVHPVHDSYTMVADVYRSRRGLLAGPPVPAVTVRSASGAADARETAHRVGAILAPLLDGAPVPVARGTAGVTVLFAMVDPADVTRAHGALRDGMSDAVVTRRALDLDGLAALGALGGRLEACGAPEPPG